jgi:hypothetical protein
MPGWYDIASLEDINAREDKEGLHESQRWVMGPGRYLERQGLADCERWVRQWGRHAALQQTHR